MKLTDLLNDEDKLKEFDRLRDAYVAARELQRLRADKNYFIGGDAQLRRFRKVWKVIGMSSCINEIKGMINKLDNNEEAQGKIENDEG